MVEVIMFILLTQIHAGFRDAPYVITDDGVIPQSQLVEQE